MGLSEAWDTLQLNGCHEDTGHQEIVDENNLRLADHVCGALALCYCRLVAYALLWATIQGFL